MRIWIATAALALVACDMEEPEDVGFRGLELQASVVLDLEETAEVLGDEAAGAASAELETVDADAAALVCECTLGTSKLTVVGLRCFVETCTFVDYCPLFTGNWGTPVEIPCPPDVIGLASEY